MATREQLIEDFADHKYATGEKFARLINSMKVVQEPVVDPQALGTSLSFIDSISQDADGKITATKKTLDLANAHELNPFKGWWKTGDTLPTSGFDGAYLYFKDTTQTPAVTTIYRWNGTTYAPTGTVVDESNVQTFGSGQQVNEVKIKDENGVEVQGTADVLSAEAGEKMAQEIWSEINVIYGKSFTSIGSEQDASNDFAIATDTIPIEIGTSYRWYSEMPSSGTLRLRKIDTSSDEPKYGTWDYWTTGSDDFGTYRQFTPTGNDGNFQMAFYGDAAKAKLCKVVGSSLIPVWTPKTSTGLVERVNKISLEVASMSGLPNTVSMLNTNINGGEELLFENDIAHTSIYWADGSHYIAPNGTLVSHNAWKISSPFTLKQGQTAYIKTEGSGVCIVAKVTESEGSTTYTPLKNIPSGTTGLNEYTYIADADTLIVVSAKVSSGGVVVKLIDEGLYARINALEDGVYTGNKKQIHSIFAGYFSSAGNVVTSKRYDWTYAGWFYCPDYIPVNGGDTVISNYGKYGPIVQCIVGYDSNKVKNHNWLAGPPFTTSKSGTREIQVSNDTSYIRFAFYKEWIQTPDYPFPDGVTEGDKNTVPLIINGVSYVVDDITLLNSHDALSYPIITNYGYIGEAYPKEIEDITSLLTARPTSNYHRFHFLHISDTHGNGGSKIFGYANDLLTYVDAKFLVHTGDIVHDLFSDGVNSATIDAINSCTKPFYWVLGNHDYGVVGTGGHAAVFTQYMTPMNNHNEADGVNGVTVNETYYSIDYSTEKVKCIFLDMNDGWTDAELENLGVSSPGSTSGKMSDEQISWFIQELQNAAANNLHVCCFIHTTPYEQNYDSSIKEWADVRNSAGLDVVSGQKFLAEIVDAFLDGASATFQYNGISYTANFTTAGHFVGWFCGHTHYDNAGFMKGHERQFIINVSWPQNYGNYSTGYLEDGLGVQFNYITIDTNLKSLAVYRVGCQKTICGTERKSFRVLYL